MVYGVCFMKLSEQDANLFFDLMWSLQFYVKKRLDLFPDIKTLKQYRELDGKLRMEGRNAVWDNPQLIAEYVKENPDNLPQEQLEIVNSWQGFVRDKFFIERLLKKYAVFIKENDTVYGVLGLYDELDEIIHKSRLPLFVQAVLLPFRDVIVYDGVLSSYPVMFGGGYKANLKDAYMEAKRDGAIILSFNQDTQQEAQAAMQKPLKDWQPLLSNLIEEAKALRAQPGSPPTWGPSFSLIKASLALAETAVANPDDIRSLWKSLERLDRAIQKMENAVHRSS